MKSTGITVSVQLHFSNQQLRLQMEANGIGMEEIQFGFGLNRMKERLKLFHDTVSVHSESGEGTFVICNIPLQTEPVQDAIRLLIVDDQVSITNSLKQILDQHADFNVVDTAGTGAKH